MDSEILIVDDDAIVANLLNDILRGDGFTTRIVRDCTQAEEAARLLRPRLVILDVMLPGADGITLLRRLKEDPALYKTRFIILSGKTFPQDKERALKGGADLFLEKPFNLDSFPESIRQLIGAPSRTAGAAEKKTPGLGVAIWGCRALAKDAPRPSRYGTRTPCVAVQTTDRLFILDAGSGIVPLGQDPSALGEREIWILLARCDPAHLQGLGRFAPAGETGRTLKIAAPLDNERSLKASLQESFAASGALPLKARLELFPLQEQDYELAPNVKLNCLHAHHPGATLAYALELEGKKVVYAPDSELSGEAADALEDYDEKLARFARDADLLIHDAHFSEEDFVAQSGHSSFQSALHLASRAAVRELTLFHLNADYTDERLDEIEKTAQAKAAESPFPFRCRVAREGLSLSL